MRFVFDVNAQNEPARQWAKTAATCCIGRAHSCDLVLTSELVSGQHAVIDGSGATPVLRDLRSRNGTYLNGKRVETSAIIYVGDVVMFGQNGPTLTIRSVETEPASTPTKSASGERSRTARNEVRIGRAPDNDIVLDEQTVSAYHARLVMDRPAHGILEDLGSMNGTAIREANNKVAKAEITPGTLIYFGSAPMRAEELFRHGPEWPKTVAAQLPVAEPMESGSKPYAIIGMVAVAGCALMGALLYLAIGRSSGGAPSRPTDESQSRASAAPDDSKGTRPIPSDATKQVDATVTPAKGPTASPAVSHHELPAPPTMDAEAIAGRVAPAIVWIGVRQTTKGEGKTGEKEELVVPYAAAFAVKPDLLYTTAYAAAELQQFASKGDLEAIAWANDTAVKIQSFKIHPQYQADTSWSDASLRHNLGLVQLASPLGATCSVASADAIRSLQPGMPLLLDGYYSLRKEINEYDRTQLRPEHTPLSIRSAEHDRPGVSPLFVVDIPSVKDSLSGRWLDGSPVFDADGNVVSIAFITNGIGHIIPLDPSFWSNP